MDRRRIAMLATAVIFIAYGVFLLTADTGRGNLLPACPSNTSSFTGSCSRGHELYRYDNGIVCQTGFVGDDGEGFWQLGGRCL